MATAPDRLILEMIGLQKALPPRPAFPELELVLSTISKANDALAAKRDELSRHPRPYNVPPGVFFALQEMRKEVLKERAQEQRRAAEALVQLEQRHRLYDGWIQQAYGALSSQSENGLSPLQSSEVQKQSFVPSKTAERGDVTRSAHFSSAAHEHEPTCKPSTSANIGLSSNLTRTLSGSSLRGEKLVIPTIEGKHSRKVAPAQDGRDLPSTYKVLTMLELASKRQQKTLNLQGAFLKEIEWVPDSLGRLTWLTDLNLSGNRLNTLPESIGELSNLINLDVSGNQLKAIPESLGRLTCLEILNIERNKIEELPWTIGQCTALVELNAGFNQLKALPEATGKLKQLRCLFVHLNALKHLPSTMASMSSLTDLDAHFNQLGSIPESLCQVTTLTRLNLASNFSDLKELPKQIGRLHKLKVLNISNNHLTSLPESFALLTSLEGLDLEGNPLRLPPLHIAEQGKEAVLNYMADYIAAQDHRKKKPPKITLLARLICAWQ